MEAQAAVAAAAVVGSGGGVRVVARICAPADAATTNPAAANSFQVAATRGGSHPRSPDAAALLSFTAATPPSSSSSSSSSSQGRAPNPRKEEHRLDWCYLPHETNREVFLNEVRPLVHHLLGATSCSNTCVVSCGKDHLFMGSQDQPGLVTMAVEEILEFSKGAVRVSSYQVLQDTHIFDLLEPKDQEVLILEDAQGRTHLKGLSRVQVKSIEDFVQLSCFDSHQNKQPNKASTQLHPRGHQGLIIHISSFDQEGRECAVAKMNFLNLTGYVDPKQKNNGGAVAALSNSNKSMYAMMNVVQALNNNQSFVPYRQSKVTRILQDSLCKASGAVLIACLDEISCPDTVSALSLAARSSQVANEQYRRSMSATSSKRPNVNLSANAKSSSKSFLPSMHQPNPVVEKHDRPQWNNSAVKACRTPIAKKRSQPIMHSAKKTESSLSTPITMKQKDAKSSMSERSQPIMHSAKKTESSLSTPITMKQKDAKSSKSERSQPIMHSAKKTESSLSTPITMKQKDAKSSMSESSQSTMHSARKSESSFSTSIKMKQKDAKSTMGGRSQLIACSAKKTESSLSTSIKTKQKDAKPTTSESILLCPSINSSKEDALVVVPTAVKEVEEVQSSHDMEIHAPSKDEGFDKTRDTLDIVSSETQKVVSSMEEEDYSSSGLHALSSCTDLGETCSSYVPDVLVEKSPVNANKRSPKLSDRLREISNSLKLLSARPLSITTQKVDMETPQKVGMEMPQRAGMEYVQPINIDVPEPKTPAMHLKFEHAENPSNSFKARSTGIKKSLLQECLTFLNSANKEQLKSLKGIGEKRANFIIELRENSPELFKEVDDLRDIIGMNKAEIKRMMSGIIDS